jgi:hypothetical protein
MRIVVRLLLAWFAFFGLALGLWQWLFPASFYADFPGLGHRWVSPDGPYNEHLMRDVGQGNLAVGTVALVALLTGVVWLARAVGLAAVAANVPHHVYHQANVSILPGPADQVLQSLTLSAVTVAAIVLAVSAFRLPADPAPSGRRTVPASSVPTDPARS